MIEADCLVPIGEPALNAFREFLELAVGDLMLLAKFRKLVDDGTPLFRIEVDGSLAMGASRASVLYYPSDSLHELLAAARVRALDGEFDNAS